MSTESAERAAPSATSAPAPKHSIVLTKGAAYLLEGILQVPMPFPKTKQIASAARMWGKLRRENQPKHSGYDFERGLIKATGEADNDWLVRQQAFNDARDAWREESITLGLSDRQRDICRTGLAWALKNRDKVLPENNNHILSLIEGFEIDDESAGDAE